MSPTAADLLGAWRLLSWTIDYPASGRITQPFGEDAIGLLMYTEDGHVSATLARRERGRFSTAVVPRAPTVEKATAFDGYMHYAGRFHVEAGVVHHRVELALNMDLVGTVQVREAALDGDRLALSAEEALADGGTRRHRLLWRRAESR